MNDYSIFSLWELIIPPVFIQSVIMPTESKCNNNLFSPNDMYLIKGNNPVLEITNKKNGVSKITAVHYNTIINTIKINIEKNISLNNTSPHNKSKFIYKISNMKKYKINNFGVLGNLFNKYINNKTTNNVYNLENIKCNNKHTINHLQNIIEKYQRLFEIKYLLPLFLNYTKNHKETQYNNVIEKSSVFFIILQIQQIHNLYHHNYNTQITDINLWNNPGHIGKNDIRISNLINPKTTDGIFTLINKSIYHPFTHNYNLLKYSPNHTLINDNFISSYINPSITAIIIINGVHYNNNNILMNINIIKYNNISTLYNSQTSYMGNVYQPHVILYNNKLEHQYNVLSFEVSYTKYNTCNTSIEYNNISEFSIHYGITIIDNNFIILHPSDKNIKTKNLLKSTITSNYLNFPSHHNYGSRIHFIDHYIEISNGLCGNSASFEYLNGYDKKAIMFSKSCREGETFTFTIVNTEQYIMNYFNESLYSYLYAPLGTENNLIGYLKNTLGDSCVGDPIILNATYRYYLPTVSLNFGQIKDTPFYQAKFAIEYTPLNKTFTDSLEINSFLLNPSIVLINQNDLTITYYDHSLIGSVALSYNGGIIGTPYDVTTIYDTINWNLIKWSNLSFITASDTANVQVLVKNTDGIKVHMQDVSPAWDFTIPDSSNDISIPGAWRQNYSRVIDLPDFEQNTFICEFNNNTIDNTIQLLFGYDLLGEKYYYDLHWTQDFKIKFEYYTGTWDGTYVPYMNHLIIIDTSIQMEYFSVKVMNTLKDLDKAISPNDHIMVLGFDGVNENVLMKFTDNRSKFTNITNTTFNYTGPVIIGKCLDYAYKNINSPENIYIISSGESLAVETYPTLFNDNLSNLTGTNVNFINLGVDISTSGHSLNVLTYGEIDRFGINSVFNLGNGIFSKYFDDGIVIHYDQTKLNTNNFKFKIWNGTGYNYYSIKDYPNLEVNLTHNNKKNIYVSFYYTKQIPNYGTIQSSITRKYGLTKIETKHISLLDTGLYFEVGKFIPYHYQNTIGRKFTTDIVVSKKHAKLFDSNIIDDFRYYIDDKIINYANITNNKYLLEYFGNDHTQNVLINIEIEIKDGDDLYHSSISKLNQNGFTTLKYFNNNIQIDNTPSGFTYARLANCFIENTYIYKGCSSKDFSGYYVDTTYYTSNNSIISEHFINVISVDQTQFNENVVLLKRRGFIVVGYKDNNNGFVDIIYKGYQNSHNTDLIIQNKKIFTRLDSVMEKQIIKGSTCSITMSAFPHNITIMPPISNEYYEQYIRMKIYNMTGMSYIQHGSINSIDDTPSFKKQQNIVIESTPFEFIKYLISDKLSNYNEITVRECNPMNAYFENFVALYGRYNGRTITYYNTLTKNNTPFHISDNIIETIKINYINNEIIIKPYSINFADIYVTPTIPNGYSGPLPQPQKIGQTIINTFTGNNDITSHYNYVMYNGGGAEDQRCYIECCKIDNDYCLLLTTGILGSHDAAIINITGANSHFNMIMGNATTTDTTLTSDLFNNDGFIVRNIGTDLIINLNNPQNIKYIKIINDLDNQILIDVASTVELKIRTMTIYGMKSMRSRCSKKFKVTLKMFAWGRIGGG